MCNKHYSRWYRGDSVKRRTRPAGMSPASCLYWYGWTVTDSGCWEWRGSVLVVGYGQFRTQGVSYTAHRVAYEHWVGPIPEGHVVRHKCDNPPCMNPDHLEPGTPADNSADCVARGRSLKGALSPSAKLTADEVREIRSEYELGIMTQKMLGDVYGVDAYAISAVVRRLQYADV